MISCDKHDYLEIACTFALDIEILCKNGKRYRGKAKTIVLNDSRQECLVLLVDNVDLAIEPVAIEHQTTEHSTTEHSTTEQYIVLDELATMTALSNNPHFDVITF